MSTTVPKQARAFIGVYFECCKAYNRLYRNAKQTAYEGRCPRCLALAQVPIGAGGTSARVFVGRRV